MFCNNDNQVLILESITFAENFADIRGSICARSWTRSPWYSLHYVVLIVSALVSCTVETRDI